VTDIRRTGTSDPSLDTDGKFLGAILAHTSDVLVVVDLDYVARWVSPNSDRISGWRLTGVPENGTLVHPDDIQAFAVALKSAADHGSARVRYRFRHRQGHYTPFDAVITDMRHVPEVAGLVIAARDVSGEPVADDVVARQTEFIVRWRPDGLITWVNPAMQMLGTPGGGRLVGRAITDVFAGGTKIPVEELLADAISTVRSGSTSTCCVSYRYPNGERGWIDWVSRGVHGTDGRLVEVQSVGRDATSRIIAERRAKHDLTHQAAFFGAVVTGSSDLAAVVDADWSIRWLAPSMAVLLGIDAPGPGSNRALDRYIVADDRVPADEMLLDAALYGNSQATIRMVDAKGSARWIEAHAVDQRHDPAVRGFVINGRDVTDRVEAEATLRWYAHHDWLTGLTNRRGVLASAIDGPVAVVWITVDGLDNVTTPHGLDAGDAVLIEAAERLRTAAPPAAVVARIYGSEFVVAGRVEEIEPDAVADAAIEALTKPYTVGEHRRARLHATAGIAVGGDDTSLDEVLAGARAAAREALDRASARPVVWTPGLRQEHESRRSLDEELVDAFEQGQFEVHYQPEVELATGRIIGAEALLRWRHPSDGLLSADRFVAAAKRIGLLEAVDRWVLTRAVADASRWPDQTIALRVNLIATELMDPELPDRFSRVCQQAGVSTDRLIVEINETSLVPSSDAAIENLAALRASGIRIDLDDFGVGYSSLAYLHELPVDGVKLDRTFLSRLDEERSRVVTIATVELAHRLALSVTAEGVECTTQARALERIGVRRAQGFLFGKAVPSSIFEDRLRR
jgi:predicted signal transduction protein with EAL and GGDEF domain